MTLKAAGSQPGVLRDSEPGGLTGSREGTHLPERTTS